MGGHSKGNDMIRWFVIVADFLIFNAVLFAFTFFAPKFLPHIFEDAMKITIFVGNTSLCVAELFYSTIIHIRRISFLNVIKRTLGLALLTTLAFFISTLLLTNGEKGMSTSFLVLGGCFYLLLLVSRYIELSFLKSYRKKGYNGRTVVFVGNDPAVIEMYNTLIEDPSAGYHVKGYYSDAPITNAPKDFKRLGDMDTLNKLMDTSINDAINGTPSNVGDCFCCLSHDQSDEVIRIMKFCDNNVIHFYYMPRQFGEYKLHLDSLHFMGKTIYTNHLEPLTSPSNRAIKRAFDIAVSGVVCLCMLPFIPFIALAIKLQSPGPLFFKQARTGLNGNTFYCLKFRSMHVNKDADKIQATKDDPRKFAFGNFMRKTNIDEFPQFINVLKGDMSIVGPRPHMLHHTEIYGSLINKYMVRHFSKPGITGWAQVTGFRGETKELWQMEERIRRDIWYIENWSFWLDIKIIYLTAKSIIFPDKNAY